jgi:hypothetical protein
VRFPPRDHEDLFYYAVEKLALVLYCFVVRNGIFRSKRNHFGAEAWIEPVVPESIIAPLL